MKFVKSSPLWLGFDTEVSANVIFAMHSAYQIFGMSKSDFRQMIEFKFCLSDTEDFVWVMLKILEDGNYLEAYTKGSVTMPKKPFTPLEMKIIERFMNTYHKENLNPLQLFVEKYMEDVILVNHFNAQLIKTTVGKHFEREM